MGHSNCDRCGNDTRMCECSVNQTQVGGNHYKGEYQHWDWCIDINLGYLESAATKYLSRWRQKNGIQDIEKAKHYMMKAREAFSEGRHENRSHMVTLNGAMVRVTHMFLSGLNIPQNEQEIIAACSAWSTVKDLDFCISEIQKLIVAAKRDNVEGWRNPAVTNPTRPAFKAPPEAAGGAARMPGSPWPGGQANPFGYQGDG